MSAAVLLAGCRSSSEATAELAPLDESPIFSSSEYGVPVSPRMTNLKRVPKGGGREQVGKPYQVRGKWYYPKEEPGYSATGDASWYGSNFHGRLTANGEIYDMYHLSAAHPTFPLPSYARVTNERNGRSVLVRVNDRGPFAHGRVVDVSQRAAEVLDFRHAGIAEVTVEYVGRAPLEGDDGPMLMASLRQGGSRSIDDGLPSGVMVASNDVSSATPSTAISYNGASVMPAVRPPLAAGAIRDGLAVPAAEGAISFSPSAVPLPTMRGAVLSYAPAEASTGAFAALTALTSPAQVSQTTAAERIEIGTVDDLDLLLRIHAMAEGRGRLLEEEGGEGRTLALVVNRPGTADELLRDLWTAGATDAFVLRP